MQRCGLRQAFQADVILGDVFYPCSAVLSERLGGVPIVGLLTSNPILPFLNPWWAGSGRRAWLPAPLAYIPQSGSGYVHPMVRLLSCAYPTLTYPDQTLYNPAEALFPTNESECATSSLATSR